MFSSELQELILCRAQDTVDAKAKNLPYILRDEICNEKNTPENFHQKEK